MFFLKKYISVLLFFLIKILINLKLNFLASFLIYLSIRKLNRTKKNNKNVVILEKSHGIEDIRIAYKDNNEDINLFILQRKIFQIIFISIFKNRSKELRDDSYVMKDRDLQNKQEELLNFLNQILSNLNKFIKISALISFNYKYYAERELHKACKKNSIKFIVCHKECNVFDGELIYYNKILEKIGKFQGDLITVYNNRYKDLLIKHKIIEQNKVVVTGMPRADTFFQINKRHNKHILIFLISTRRSLKYVRESEDRENISQMEKIVNWDTLAEETIQTIVDVAKDYPNIDFIFKTKVKIDEQTKNQQEIIKKAKLSNCKIKYGGQSAQHIKEAKFVIGFNTTGIIESLIAKKEVIVPFFGISEDNLKKKFVLDDHNLTLKAKNKKDLERLLVQLIEGKPKEFQSNTEEYNKLFYEHIGNHDGKSSQRLRKVIGEVIN